MPGSQKSRRIKTVLLGAFLGALTFLLVYGPGPLDVTNDGWIWMCYDEHDIVQHYGGEMAALHSSWQFPLGQADTMMTALPEGVNIAFMDALPLVSLFFKLFAPLLPATFQFEGIYAFASFILQGIAASLLLGLFFEKLLTVGIGTLFFTFSPILLEREFRHTSLASHYLILFAAFLYFCHRRDHKLPWGILILSAVSTGITPYFLPMVEIFTLLIAIEHIFAARESIKSAIFFLSNCAAGMATAWLIGSVGNGYSPSRNGFGHYSMNLNALINPTSVGSVTYNYRWSVFLPVRPQILGNYDGFNYLGVGIMAMLVIGMALLCVHPSKAHLKAWLQRNGWLLAACIFLTMFAASNVITWDDKVLLAIPLPQKLIRLCCIFRASSRLFYPVYYLLILFGIISAADGVARLGTQRLAPLALGALLALQCWDLSDMISAKHTAMEQAAKCVIEIPQELENNTTATEMFLCPDWINGRMVTVLTQKLGLTTDGFDLNTRPFNVDLAVMQMFEVMDKLDRGVMREEFDGSTIYATGDADRFALWQELYAGDASFVTWEKPAAIPERFWDNDAYFMIPNAN